MIAIDLFAGLGGFTAGAIAAGVDVIWAANHWPEAVKYHQLNHPETDTLCQDLHQANWSRVPSHDILLASPCCQGHSKASGKKHNHPKYDESRSTAWAVVSCAEFHHPEWLVVENVQEFQKWQLFPIWRNALEALGYKLEYHVIDSADCGVPQNRIRLFIVGRKEQAPGIEIRETAHRPAYNFINFESGRWSSIHNKAENTQKKIANGRLDYGDSFLISYYGNSKRGRTLERPIGTITTRDRWGIVNGDCMRMLSVDETRDAMGFDGNYKLPDRNVSAIKMLGNAVCPPVATSILEAIKAA